MPRRSAENTYLVEHYRPGLDLGSLGQCVAHLRDQIEHLHEDDVPLRFLCSVIVPADEAFLVLLDADSMTDVTDFYARDGSSYDRISSAVADPTCSCPPTGGWQTPTS